MSRTAVDPVPPEVLAEVDRALAALIGISLHGKSDEFASARRRYRNGLADRISRYPALEVRAFDINDKGRLCAYYTQGGNNGTLP